MKKMTVFAAGSLRRAFSVLFREFERQTGWQVRGEFAPAGLLCQRIEAGEHPALFASANLAHPQKLVAMGLAQGVQRFAGNRLCVVVRDIPPLTAPPLLAVLTDERWHLATSTPGSDPGGDYAWQLFDLLERCQPGAGECARRRARALVGGAHSPPVPAGMLAAQWLILSGQADVFVGYASYAPALSAIAGLAVRALPDGLSPLIEYGLCCLSPPDAGAVQLAGFILSPEGQRILQAAGFIGGRVYWGRETAENK